ncbi:monooxygenase [Halomonas cibimaris]|uniref:Monooxygenase n=1 Tax=Halomonas cibimaris TaxID=657012 RepID=A0ABP7L6P8_9GAMM
MPAMLHVYFPFNGPFGEAMHEMMAELAASINEEPGLRWKLWTQSPERCQAGGVYLFDDTASAEAYLAKHSARLGEMGIAGIEAQIFEVNEPLSRINGGPLGR